MWKAHFLACDEYKKNIFVYSSIIHSWKDEMDWNGLGWSITAYPESFHMLGSNWEISRSEQVLLQIEFNDKINIHDQWCW